MRSTDYALSSVAYEIAQKLRLISKGTRLRIRLLSQSRETNTDGWSIKIGDLGTDSPQLEIWLDRFSGHQERTLYAGFCTNNEKQLLEIFDHVSDKLWPVIDVTEEDIEGYDSVVLSDRLKRNEFNKPIYENYDGGAKYYGFYSPVRASSGPIDTHFCSRAVAFFEDVARCLPEAKERTSQQEVYPQYENRETVGSHLRRERSGYLAIECKIRDGYVCQVCDFRFQDLYGNRGVEFAEAHHIVPLSQLKQRVKTKLDDLVTVCANCHRMLHRMPSKKNDLKTLKAIVKKNRQ